MGLKFFGGDLRLRNLPGKGCVFGIELPVAAAVTSTLAQLSHVTSNCCERPPARPLAALRA